MRCDMCILTATLTGIPTCILTATLTGILTGILTCILTCILNCIHSELANGLCENPTFLRSFDADHSLIQPRVGLIEMTEDVRKITYIYEVIFWCRSILCDPQLLSVHDWPKSLSSTFQPSSEPQGQIVGRAGNWGERRNDGGGGGGGEKGGGRGEVRKTALFSPPPPLRRRFPPAPRSAPGPPRMPLNTSTHPLVLTHSPVPFSNGIGRSGTFCAIYSTVERLKIEQVVDVFQTVKLLRTKRPGAVETLVRFICTEVDSGEVSRDRTRYPLVLRLSYD